MTITYTRFGVFGNSLRLAQRDDDTEVDLQVRRVTTDERGEHVQIEIEVAKFGEKRTSYSYGTLILTPAQVDVLVTALTKLHPPHSGASRPHSEEDADYRAFYGLPPKKPLV